MRKALVATLVWLTVAPLLPAPTQQVVSRVFDWRDDAKIDITEWLKANEALLKRGAGCSVTYSWRGDGTEYGSASQNAAEFIVLPEDEEVIHLVPLGERGLEARVGVRYYHNAENGRQHQISIVLALEGDPKDIFNELSRAEASTVREAKWRGVSVTKGVRKGSLLYRVSLWCGDGNTYLSFLRRPLKRAKPK